ncbi:MAG: Ig-like domain-containing protein, partial [Treponema sp.]|nr:Ig-like domain-containing protein [Treponema sp.]
MKNSKAHTRTYGNCLFPVLITILALFLSACFSPYSGSEHGFITLNFSGNARGAAWPPYFDDDDILEWPLVHRVVLESSDDSLTVYFQPRETHRSIPVMPGLWTVTVTALHEDKPYAYGSTTVNVQAGRSASALITMNPVSLSLVIDISGDEGDDSITPLTENGIPGTEVELEYTLDDIKFYNALSFSGVSAVLGPVTSAGSGSITYTMDSRDAVNGVITIFATFTHSDLQIDTITFAEAGPLHKTFGDEPFTNTATTGSGTGVITWESNDLSVATVSETGEVTIESVGSAVITATREQDAQYEEATASYTLNVSHRIITTITITGIIEPVMGELQVTEPLPSGEGWSATTMFWTPAPGTFSPGTQYTIIVNLATDSNHRFIGTGLTATINGEVATVSGTPTPASATIVYGFPPTAIIPVTSITEVPTEAT